MTPTLEELQAKYPGADTFRFGDSSELSDELLALVRAGRKTATCSHMAAIEAGALPPTVGRRDIALNFDGTPALVIETLQLAQTTFQEMTEDLALMEGENESLEGWRRDHETYYRRLGVFAPDMALIWERFSVVEDFGGAADA